MLWVDLLGGVMTIEGDGIKAIPNYARLNRGGASQVWIIENPNKIVAVPPAEPTPAPAPPPVPAPRPDLEPRTACASSECESSQKSTALQ